MGSCGSLPPLLLAQADELKVESDTYRRGWALTEEGTRAGGGLNVSPADGKVKCGGKWSASSTDTGSGPEETVAGLPGGSSPSRGVGCSAVSVSVRWVSLKQSSFGLRILGSATEAPPRPAQPQLRLSAAPDPLLTESSRSIARGGDGCETSGSQSQGPAGALRTGL